MRDASEVSSSKWARRSTYRAVAVATAALRTTGASCRQGRPKADKKVRRPLLYSPRLSCSHRGRGEESKSLALQSEVSSSEMTAAAVVEDEDNGYDSYLTRRRGPQSSLTAARAFPKDRVMAPTLVRATILEDADGNWDLPPHHLCSCHDALSARGDGGDGCHGQRYAFMLPTGVFTFPQCNSLYIRGSLIHSKGKGDSLWLLTSFVPAGLTKVKHVISVDDCVILYSTSIIANFLNLKINCIYYFNEDCF